MKNRRRGKDLERFLAKDLGGRRVGILGQEDVTTDRFSIECKEREAYPAFLEQSMAQAIRNSLSGDKIPVFILHRLNQGHDTDLVMMRYGDWKNLINGGIND
jgi:hypothetical protein